VVGTHGAFSFNTQTHIELYVAGAAHKPPVYVIRIFISGMQMGLCVEETFVQAVSFAQAKNAGDGHYNTRSWLHIAAEDLSNEDPPAPRTLASLGAWADIVSDSEEELEASESARTPLNIKASAFVPKGPIISMAPSFDPSCLRTVNMPKQDPDYLDGPVPDMYRSGPGPRRLAVADPDGDQPPRQVPIQPQTATTVILRNLPCGLTRKALLWNLMDKGFAGLYDFAYVPMDFGSRLCRGFAFVNLASGEHVQHLIEVFDGHRCWSPKLQGCSKVCRASLSRCQGLAANIERYRNSAVMGAEVDESFKPVVFVGRRQVAFPEPTRKSNSLRKVTNNWCP